MKEFAQLLELLALTPSRNRKIEALKDYFARTPDPDRLSAGRSRDDPRSPYRTQASPIRIGDRVWLGAGTIVLPGVTIGDNVTIGAGSLVTEDLPPDVLAFGHPCRVQRTL